MSLRTRAAISFTVTITITLLAVALLARAYTVAVNRQESITDRVDPAARATDSLRAADATAAAGFARYVATGGPEERSLTTSALDRSDALLHRLAPLLEQDAGLAALLARTATAQAIWVSSHVAPGLAAMAAGDRKAAVRILDDPTWQAAFIALDAANLELADGIDRLGAQAGADLRRTTERLGFAIAVAALLGIAIWAYFLIALRGWVLTPLRAVRSDLGRATRAADHDHPITERGPLEIAELAADAEELRRSLVREIDIASAARSAMHHDAPAIAMIERVMATPRGAPPAGLAISGTTRAADGIVAGDWWDAMTLPDGTLAFVVADVSGHDLEAGLTAFPTRQVLRSGLMAGLPLDVVMGLAAASVADSGHVLTAFIGCIDMAQERLTWVNAGHPAAIIIGTYGQPVKCGPTGPLASTLESTWRVREVPFHPGDVCVAFSDGLIESMDDTGAELSLDGVVSLLAHMNARSGIGPPELAERLLGLARARASNWSDDDTTLLVISRT